MFTAPDGLAVRRARELVADTSPPVNLLDRNLSQYRLAVLLADELELDEADAVTLVGEAYARRHDPRPRRPKAVPF